MEKNKTASVISDNHPKENLADKAIIVVIGNLVSGLGKIILSIILVRLIAKADYGSYRQAMMLYATFGMIFLFGIPQSIYYFIPQLSKEDQKRLSAQSFIYLFFFGSLLTIAFYFLSGNIAEWFNNDALTSYIKIFSPYFLFMLPTQAIIPLLISINRHKAAAITSIIFMMVSIVSVLLPLFIGFGLAEIFISMVAFAFIQILVVILYTAKLLQGFVWKWNSVFLKRQFAYAYPIGLSQVVGIISRALDKYIISFAFMPERFATYEIGAKEIPLVNILPYSISNVLQPKLVEYYQKGDLDTFIKLWHASIRKVSLIMLPIFVFLFITAQELMVFLYTSNYIGSVLIFRIYLCLLPLRVTAYGPILMAAGRPKFVFLATCIGLGLNLCLSIGLLQLIGFVGPAIATVITQCFVIILYLKKISQILHLHFWEIFPFKPFLQIFSIAALCGFFIYPIIWLRYAPIIVLFIGAGAFIFIYGLLLRALKILKKEDISVLKRWITLGILTKKYRVSGRD